MKTKLTLFMVLFIILVAFTAVNGEKEPYDNSIENTKKNFKGTWERVSYYNYDENGKVTDSFSSSSANRHIKIYTDSKVMWCRNVASDSTEWFGYGTYNIHDDLLSETLEYGSKTMTAFISQNPEFVFKFTISKDKYSQIQIDEEGHPIFAENYIRLE
ncbi:hypothetical protein [uncultured Algibacter sp.]|uniref:hypothetical protein n=1 Tax=uncultured Algibacter sp. TaxID=298659 RepID=UPI00261C4A4C|nr:hypothetical protein [uncultured Algibacter sp.]